MVLVPKYTSVVRVKVNHLLFYERPGQRNESIFLEQLMEQGAVQRSGRGRPRLRPKRVVGDKGYTGRRIRSYSHFK